MRERADRVSQVVHRVEEADQVVAVLVRRGAVHLERQPVGDPRLGGRLRRPPDGLLVVVHADERRVRERLRHQDGGGAEAAADVEHVDALLQPLDEAGDLGEPLGEQGVAVERAEEPLHAAEQARVVLVPGDALAGGVPVRQLVDRRPDGGDGLVAAGHRGRAVVVGEDDGVLGREGERARLLRRTARSRRPPGGEPLPQVALGQPGVLRQLLAGHRAGGGQGPPDAEPVAEVGENGIAGRTLVDRDLAGELLDPREVDVGGGFLGGLHGSRVAMS